MNQDEKQKVGQLLQRAIGAHQTGRIAEAEDLYRQALSLDPNQPDALHLLGLIAHQSGHNGPAINMIKRAIAVNNGNPVYHGNLSLILNAEQMWPEAEAAAEKALALNSGSADYYNYLGFAQAQQEKIQQAEDAYRRGLDLDASNGDIRNNLGTLLASVGCFEEAVSEFQAALGLDPNSAMVLANLSSALFSSGHINDAEKACRDALRIQPDHVPFLETLGNILTKKKDYDGAQETLSKVAQKQPDNAQVRCNLAAVYAYDFKPDQAIVSYEEALRIDPNYTEACVGLGLTYSELGDRKNAEAILWRAIEIDPNCIDAYYALGNSEKVEFDDYVLKTLLDMTRDSDLSEDQRSKLHFTLGFQLERKSEIANSFDHFELGNAARKRDIDSQGDTYNRAYQEKFVSRIKKTFSVDLFSKFTSPVTSSAKPVFVLGMPRSGTTLVERIAAAHSKIETGGELDDIEDLIGDIVGSNGYENLFPEVIEDLSGNDLIPYAEKYLDKLNALSPDAPRVIDKMPFNFVFMGFIAVLFPNARIIHCRRDLRDIGLSCFLQRFDAAHPWSWELADIGHYLKSYCAIMDHWREVLPLDIYEVDYEKLVADQEGQSRKIIDFIGMEWEEACLQFQNSKGMVKTASKWQVRQPVHSQSVARWKIFESRLSPMIEELSSAELV